MVKRKMAKAVEKKEAVIAIRIKPSTKATAEKLARQEGRSLANYLEQLIERAAAEKTKGARL
jgi:predicted HicB family RNase H-like nuclease